MDKINMISVFGQIIPVLKEPLDEYDGMYCSDKKTILIKDTLKDDQYLITLIHEFIHSVFDRVGITHQLSDDLEEIICHCLSESLLENYDIRTKDD